MKTKIFFIIICSAFFFLQSSCKRDYKCVCDFKYVDYLTDDSTITEEQLLVDYYYDTFKWSVEHKCNPNNYTLYWNDSIHPQSCTLERYYGSWLNLF